MRIGCARRLRQTNSLCLITAHAETWREPHQELWELLVPSGGAAVTVQGEVIRISGRIANELEGNGGINWDSAGRYPEIGQYLKALRACGDMGQGKSHTLNAGCC